MQNTRRVKSTLLILIAFLAFSCRKGEEDPSISLKSRKSRMAADWRMKSGSVAFTVNLTDPPYNYNETWTFDGSSFELNTTEAGPPTIYTGKYFLNVSIHKDGTFKMDEFLMGRGLQCSGTWCFANGRGEEKNKETAVFTITDIQKGATYNGMFNQTMDVFRYNLVKLTKEEIKIRADGFRQLAEGNQSVSMNNEYTFSSNE